MRRVVVVWRETALHNNLLILKRKVIAAKTQKFNNSLLWLSW